MFQQTNPTQQLCAMLPHSQNPLMLGRSTASNRGMRCHLLVSTIVALSAFPLVGCSSSDSAAPKAGVQYLAVGDSIAYGDNGFIAHTADARPDPGVYVGYPDLVGMERYDG